MSKPQESHEAIYDARILGIPKMLILGVQHTFAMFGATVLVPLLTGLSVSTTLLCAGLGTLLFHLITKGKVPAFLGSSFAYLGGFSIVAPMLADADGWSSRLCSFAAEQLPKACPSTQLPEDLAGRLEAESLQLWPDGRFEVWLRDADYLWEPSVRVTGTVSGGPCEVELEG